MIYLYEHRDAEETRERIQQLGRKCILICGDLTNEIMSKHVVDQTIKYFGKINILVNNHAVQYVQKSILDITDTSKGWPARFIGTSAVLVPKVLTSFAEKEEGINGVQMGPGATPFTRIPFLINDNERDLVNVKTAPLVEE